MAEYSVPVKKENGVPRIAEIEGLIYPPKTMFFRHAIGTAGREKDGVSYEISMNMGGSQPLVRSKQTGKWWTTSWEDVVNCAVRAGIDSEDDGTTDKPPWCPKCKADVIRGCTRGIWAIYSCSKCQCVFSLREGEADCD